MHFQAAIAHSERKVMLFDAQIGCSSMMLESESVARQDSSLQTHISSPLIHWHFCPRPQSMSQGFGATRRRKREMRRCFFFFSSSVTDLWHRGIPRRTRNHQVLWLSHPNSRGQNTALRLHPVHLGRSTSRWYGDWNSCQLKREVG